ncbi:TetR/AcrR family transcriptional regulator [Saccharopolyspora halophila]|uniref:TetR/AcrR family transcriptional regulator n=1 Tax=Saccharopolyspora halophila TaxID=405551 RepID=A0ABN3G0Z5_9PSEU
MTSTHESTRAQSPDRQGRRTMSEKRRALQRLEISRAAVRLFREQGVAETSGEQIAAAVGLSVRTLWRYFRNKESCVEPLLSQAVDRLVDTLKDWPEGQSLEEYLVAGEPPEHVTADAEAALAVVRMSRDEPALRAIWLVTHERAEGILAELIAQRLDRSVEDLAVRVQAATLNTALRITLEDLAVTDCTEGGAIDDGPSRLFEAIRAATHGVLGSQTM